MSGRWDVGAAIVLDGSGLVPYSTGMKKTDRPSEQEVFALAAKARVALKTAKRAMVEGVEVIKGSEVRRRLREAMGGSP